jgi:hypothetical protein
VEVNNICPRETPQSLEEALGIQKKLLSSPQLSHINIQGVPHINI